MIEKPGKWGLHEVESLPTYVDDNVCLMGDAAHGMLSHQGAGAGQAVEDAYVLANLLGHPQTSRGNLSVRIICVSSWKAR